METPTERLAAHEIALLEDHAATISRTLEILRYGLTNARQSHNAALARRIDTEIAYLVERLASLHARRDALRQALTKGGGAERG